LHTGPYWSILVHGRAIGTAEAPNTCHLAAAHPGLSDGFPQALLGWAR
jgi:hypothetical protein